MTTAPAHPRRRAPDRRHHHPRRPRGPARRDGQAAAGGGGPGCWPTAGAGSRTPSSPPSRRTRCGWRSSTGGRLPPRRTPAAARAGAGQGRPGGAGRRAHDRGRSRMPCCRGGRPGASRAGRPAPAARGVGQLADDGTGGRKAGPTAVGAGGRGAGDDGGAGPPGRDRRRRAGSARVRDGQPRRGRACHGRRPPARRRSRGRDRRRRAGRAGDGGSQQPVPARAPGVTGAPSTASGPSRWGRWEC